MAYQTPKTDWNSSNVVQPADMNRIEQNTVELKKAATIDVADANGYFTSSPKNVENVLQELAGNVQTGKSKIVSAITAMGQSAASTDTFDTLSSKIRAISTDATAGAGDVLSGKTFYQGGSKKTGTMANNGAVVLTPGVNNVAIPAGYHNGSGYVKGDDNLIASNILSGISIFGVVGNVIPKKYATGTATCISEKIDVHGLSFKPVIVIMYKTVNVNNEYDTYFKLILISDVIPLTSVSGTYDMQIYYVNSAYYQFAMPVASRSTRSGMYNDGFYCYPVYVGDNEQISFYAFG